MALGSASLSPQRTLPVLPSAMAQALAETRGEQIAGRRSRLGRPRLGVHGLRLSQAHRAQRQNSADQPRKEWQAYAPNLIIWQVIVTVPHKRFDFLSAERLYAGRGGGSSRPERACTRRSRRRPVRVLLANPRRLHNPAKQIRACAANGWMNNIQVPGSGTGPADAPGLAGPAIAGLSAKDGPLAAGAKMDVPSVPTTKLVPAGRASAPSRPACRPRQSFRRYRYRCR